MRLHIGAIVALCDYPSRLRTMRVHNIIMCITLFVCRAPFLVIMRHDQIQTNAISFFVCTRIYLVDDADGGDKGAQWHKNSHTDESARDLTNEGNCNRTLCDLDAFCLSFGVVRASRANVCCALCTSASRSVMCRVIIAGGSGRSELMGLIYCVDAK